jgi:hypothetical protein
MKGSLDPLQAMYERPARELFAARQFAVVHGSLERLPAWMTSGPLENVRALSAAYKGALEIAQGPTSPQVSAQDFIGRGGQTRVQGVRADALLRLGLTVFFADIASAVPQSADFLQSVEGALGVPRCSVAGVFANAPGSGLPWHHDSHDQLLIQLSGKKTFVHVAERLVEHPGIPFSPTSIVHPDFSAVYAEGFLDSAEAIEARGAITTTLEPGSCLFLPAGTFHRTADQPEAALSLAIAVRPPSRLDLLIGVLRHGALALPRFRAPAYGLFSQPNDEAGQPPARALSPEDVAFLARNLAELSQRDLVNAWLARDRVKGDVATGSGRPRFPYYLRVPSTELDWEPASGELITCVVRAVDAALPSRLQLATVARPIVDDLLERTRAFSVEEISQKFAEFEDAEVVDLLAQLQQVGLLCAVPFAAFREA